MEKMKFTNNQTAFEYALYMIASSYFDRTTCKSKLTEGNMLLQYKEQKLDKQYKMEDICIKYLDRLVSKCPKEIFEQNMDVHLKKHNAQGITEIIFQNEKYIISFIARYTGDSTQIEHAIWAKKENSSKRGRKQKKKMAA